MKRSTAATLATAVFLTFMIPKQAAAQQREPRTFGTTGEPLHFVVMGDSTVAGVGGTYEQGIAVSTARALAANRRVTMTNLGVSGAQFEDVRKLQLPLAQSLKPDLVLIAAAANDITHLTRVASMRADLRTIVQTLRDANPAVRIVITGSPDMGSPPRIPRILRGLTSRRTRQANEMFRAEAASLDLTFAPIADVTGPLFRKDRTLFAEDRFHPNDRGYATWIAVLNDSLASAIR